MLTEALPINLTSAKYQSHPKTNLTNCFYFILFQSHKLKPLG